MMTPGTTLRRRILPAARTLAGAALLVLASAMPTPAFEEPVEVLHILGSGKDFSEPTGVTALSDGGWMIADQRLKRVTVVSAEGRIMRHIGAGKGALQAPFDVAATDEKIFVTDTRADLVKVYDMKGVFLFAFGDSKDIAGLDEPSGISVPGDGRVYVADTGNKRIAIFTESGLFLSSVGDAPAARAVFSAPTFIDVSPDETLYITDAKEKRIRVLDRARRSRKTEVINASIGVPTGITALPGGGFGIVDQKMGQVNLYTEDFTLRTRFGSEGQSRGMIDDAHDIACNHTGQCIVADTGNNRVQVFSVPKAPIAPSLPKASSTFRVELDKTLSQPFTDADMTATGELLGILDKGGGGLVHMAPPMTAGADWVTKSPILPPPQAAGKSRASSVAVCPDGSIITADASADAIHVYDPSGAYKHSFGQSGSKDGYFSRIGGVACGRGLIVVADTGNNRVQTFSPTGVFLGAFGTKGSGRGQLKEPIDVAVTGANDIWVADENNGSVQLFSSRGALKVFLGENTGSERSQTRGLSLLLSDAEPVAMHAGKKKDAFFPDVEAIATDDDDFIYVRERGRVHVFDAGGVRLVSFGSPGSGRLEWEDGGGLAVHESLIVLPDPQNARTVIYTLGRIPDRPHGLTVMSGVGGATLTWAKAKETFVEEYNIYIVTPSGGAELIGKAKETHYEVTYTPEMTTPKFIVTAVSTKSLESGPAGPVVDYFQLGYTEYENGNMDKALSHFSDALRIQPESVLLTEYKGRALLALRREAEAEAVFKSLLSMKDGKAAGYRSLGLMAMARGDLAAAEQELNRAQSAGPRDPATLRAQAELYMAKRQYFKARERAQQSINFGHSDARSHELIGLAYAGEKLYGKASQSLARAIDLAPDRPRLYRELAEIHIKRDDADAARNVLNTGLKRFPGHADLRITRAEVEIEEGHLDKADRELSEVILQDPENARAHLLRGRLYAMQKRAEDAIAEFGSARALAPDSPEVLLALAEGYAAADMRTEALGAVNALFAVDANNQDGLLLSGRLHMEAGALDDADAVADKCLALNQANVSAHILKGDIAMRRDTPAVAIGHYAKAAQLQPENTTALLAQADAMVAAKREGEARKVYAKALRVDSANARAHFALGSLHLNTYEYDEAITELNLATYLDPTQAEYYNALGLAYLGAFQHDDAVAAFEQAQKLDPKEVQYKNNLDKAYASKKSYASSGRAPKLIVRTTGFGAVYSAAAGSYSDQPIGQIKVQNLSATLFYNIKVAFEVPEYMTAPFEAKIYELKPQQTHTVDVRPTFGADVLKLSEDTPVVGKVTVTYVEGGKAKTVSASAPLTLYTPNAIRWETKAMTGAFVTPKDWPVNEFARTTLSRYTEKGTALPQVAGSEAVAKAMLLYDALSIARVRYLEDPNQPFAKSKQNYDAVDYVQFPRDTLRLKSGDCDDLVMLYASLLENVGIRTAIVDMPGHVLVAFDTGVPQARASVLSDSPDDYILREGGAWIPIEMTVVGANFTEAWAAGVQLYHERSKKGDVTLIDTNASWESYAPVSLPMTDYRPEVPDKTALDTMVVKERERFRDRHIDRLAAPLRAKLKRNPGDTNARLRLGAVLAHNGKLSEAKIEFNTILTQDAKNYDALVNLGNVSYLEENYSAALEYYRKAEALADKDAEIKFNIALAYYKIGSMDEAKAKFGEAVEIDPQIQDDQKRFAALLNK